MTKGGLPTIDTKPSPEYVEQFKEDMLAMAEERGWKSSDVTAAYNHHIRLKQALASLVYFFQVVYDDGTPGPIKIGCSYTLESRLATIRSSNPHKVRVLGVIDGYRDIETAWHERFVAAKRHGEWYNPTPELMIAIEDESVPWTDPKGQKQ